MIYPVLTFSVGTFFLLEGEQMIVIKNIHKTFATSDLTVNAVDNVSLKIEDGEIYGVIGYSGAGKSTLVRCINFLEVPDSGSIEISGFGTISAESQNLYYIHDGKKVKAGDSQLRALRRQIGMIFQHFNLLDRCTVFENVAYSLKYTGKSKAEITEKVKNLLKLVSLEDKIDSYPCQLSGGQKQRVAIARALANDPKILLCDEATSALDPEATESILNLLKELNKKLGLTIILITHEMAVIRSICDKVAVIENGRVVEEGNVYDIFAHPKEKITKRFVNTSSGLGNITKLIHSSLVETSGYSKLLKLVFEKDCVGDAIISETSRKFNVNLSIVLANVDLIQGTPLGGMIVVMSGEEGDVEKAIEYLESCNVKVEVVEK